MHDPSALCDHLRPGTWPLRTELVLDDHLGPTDALMSCRTCGRVYLLEMLDWRDRERVMRLSRLAADHAERLIHDLGRGSCDAGRAAAQIEHAKHRAERLPWLLRIDSAGPGILGVAPLPPGIRVPAGSWRELPCDGGWVDYARSNTEMVNG